MTERKIYATEHRGPVCDFCLSPEPCWAHSGPNPHAGLQTILDPTGEPKTVYVQDNGVWAACTECADLVDRGDKAELARRSARASANTLPVAPDLPEEVLRAIGKALYEDRLAYITEALAGLGPRREPMDGEWSSDGSATLTENEPDNN